MNHHRALLDDAGSHAVGAELALAPDGAFAQPAATCRGRKAGIADVMQDHAVRVGQHDAEIVLPEPLSQAEQFHPRDRQQQAMLIAPRLQFRTIDDGRLFRALRVERIVLDATGPGITHQMVNARGRLQALHRRLDQRCMTRRFLRGQHAFLLPRHRARGREVIIVMAFTRHACAFSAIRTRYRGQGGTKRRKTNAVVSAIQQSVSVCRFIDESCRKTRNQDARFGSL